MWEPCEPEMRHSGLEGSFSVKEGLPWCLKANSETHHEAQEKEDWTLSHKYMLTRPIKISNVNISAFDMVTELQTVISKTKTNLPHPYSV